MKFTPIEFIKHDGNFHCNSLHEKNLAFALSIW